MSHQLIEFRSGEAWMHDRRSPGLWILPHLLRYAWLPFLAFFLAAANNISYSGIQVLIGKDLMCCLPPYSPMLPS